MSRHPAQFRAFIGAATLTKLLMNITRRMVYPFAPAFARGLGVELAVITSAIAINQATSLLGPFGAPFADRYGYKRLMLIALGLLTVGCFAAGFLPIYPVLLICLFLAGLAKAFFDPSLQALIGSVIPYENRGRVIGITELSWALTTLVGIPATGFIIQYTSWQVPFWILGTASLACFYLLIKTIPKSLPRQPKPSGSQPGLLSQWKRIIRKPRVLGILGFAFSISLANDALFVIYGVWLESSFQLSLAAIGLGTILIGISELIAEGAMSLFSDRIGLRRSVLAGAFCSALAYLILPFLDGDLPRVLGGLFIVFFFFEFTVVTAMCLTTELVPELRASTLSAFYAIAGLGRVIGAFLGVFIWSRYGLLGVSLVSGLSTFLAFVCILTGFYRSRPFIR